MSRLKRYVIELVIAGIVFGASTSFAAVTTSCSLEGAKLKDSPFEWSTGGKYVTLSMSIKKDIELYDRNHGGVAFSNQFGVRQYGNHCDDQKTGCYGTARATNTNS